MSRGIFDTLVYNHLKRAPWLISSKMSYFFFWFAFLALVMKDLSMGLFFIFLLLGLLCRKQSKQIKGFFLTYGGAAMSINNLADDPFAATVRSKVFIGWVLFFAYLCFCGLLVGGETGGESWGEFFFSLHLLLLATIVSTWTVSSTLEKKYIEIYNRFLAKQGKDVSENLAPIKQGWRASFYHTTIKDYIKMVFISGAVCGVLVLIQNDVGPTDMLAFFETSEEVQFAWYAAKKGFYKTVMFLA